MSRVHLKGTISGQGHGCELKATEERRAEGVRVEPWLTFDLQPNKHPQQSLDGGERPQSSISISECAVDEHMTLRSSAR